MNHMWTILLSIAVLALGVLSSSAAAAGEEFPKPKAPADVSAYGTHLQRTMTLLATSTPGKRNTVRILFYGQSITGQSWWKLVEKDLRRRFPNANIVCANLALGGFASQLLVRTAEYDLYPFYPDLLIFHVYGDHRRYEDIIRRTRERTTAEVLIQTDHVTSETEDNWTKMMNYTFLPSYAKKYNCQLSRIRDSWKEYLKDNNLKPAQLLADGVHLNKHGEYLMAELIGQELVYRPEQPADEWKDTVRTLVVGKDIKWEGEHLVLEFEGNRVDAVAAAGADMMGWTVDVDLDDKKITDIPECYYHARPSGTAGVGWPAIQRIDWQKPLMLEEWTATFTGFNDDQTDFKFSLTGSKTGPDGEGSAKEKFVSKSGRVVIAPQDWVFAYCKKVSKKSTPEGFQVRWRVKPLFVGAYHVPKVTDPTVERCTTLVQGIANGKHKLVLCGRKAVIAALRVYRPPVKAAEEGAKQDKSGQ